MFVLSGFDVLAEICTVLNKRKSQLLFPEWRTDDLNNTSSAEDEDLLNKTKQKAVKSPPVAKMTTENRCERQEEQQTDSLGDAGKISNKRDK